jgi:hypothetical protein
VTNEDRQRETDLEIANKKKGESPGEPKNTPKRKRKICRTEGALREGVKELRAVQVRDDKKGFNTPKVLWRGMTNKELSETFFSVGGKEMAVSLPRQS